MPLQYKTVQLKPLSGGLDVRSAAESVAPDGYRWVENVWAETKLKLWRRPGFEKLFGDDATYNNQDLHDQLFENAAQPVTMLFQATSVTGIRKLIAATQNRIYAYDASTGNYKILSDLLGGTPSSACNTSRFEAAQSGDITIFTNGVDNPVFWAFDQPPIEPSSQSVTTIPDLESLNVTIVGTVFTWKGLTFYGNIVEDGVRAANKLLWSDFQSPLSIVPTKGSVAGEHELDPNEIILAFAPLQDSLLIYTNRSIWEVQVVGGDEVLSFRQRYVENSGVGCLAYRYTLISTGDKHFYFGSDGIYAYDLYSGKPDRPEWLHKASAAIFSEINSAACTSHCGGYNPQTREIFFSWANGGSSCPYRTLVVNHETEFCDVIQRGFTAFVNHVPSGVKSIREWLISICACTEDALDATGNARQKEGDTRGLITASCAIVPDSIFTDVSTDIDGVPAEDWTAQPSDTSLCAVLGNMTVEDLCIGEQATCDTTKLFVCACADDFCLKQYGTIFAHELCTNRAGVGAYTLLGYDTILRSAPLDFRTPDLPKNIKNFLVEAYPALQTIPSNIQLRIGASFQASDPNEDDCAIMWRTMPQKMLTCQSGKTAAQHAKDGTRPNLGIDWPCFEENRFLYWELKISGTGGKCSFSSISMQIALRQLIK